MTHQQAPTPLEGGTTTAQDRWDRRPVQASEGGWTGWVRFGGVVMVVVGAFSVVEGLVALGASATFVTANGTVLTIGIGAWAWLHLIVGVLVLATGMALLARDAPAWARVVGVGLVGINMVVQLAWLPAAPIWSITIIVLDVLIIYALIVTWDPAR